MQITETDQIQPQSRVSVHFFSFGTGSTMIKLNVKTYSWVFIDEMKIPNTNLSVFFFDTISIWGTSKQHNNIVNKNIVQMYWKGTVFLTNVWIKPSL